jgi:antitoxin component of MazEF toxin-antitoxin module
MSYRIAVRVIRIGKNSLGMIIPRTIRDKMGIEKGEIISLNIER